MAQLTERGEIGKSGETRDLGDNERSPPVEPEESGKTSAHFTTFTPVLRAERMALGLPVQEEEVFRPAGTGLALSGGGIRSASFALGIVQELFNRDIYRRFNYLSTVSGGGYLGAALTWLAGRNPEELKNQLGSATSGARDSELSETAGKPNCVWLDFVRQHGNYLQPPRVGDLSLVGVVLRGALLSYGTYLVAAAALIGLMCAYGFMQSPPDMVASRAVIRLESVIVLAGSLLGLMIALYGIATWLSSIQKWQTVSIGSIVVVALAAVVIILALPVEATPSWLSWLTSLTAAEAKSSAWWRWPLAVSVLAAAAVGVKNIVSAVKPEHLSAQAAEKAYLSWQYESRARSQQNLGLILSVLLGSVVLWTIPPLHAWLHEKHASLASASASSLFGGAVAVYQFIRGREKESMRYSNVLVAVAAVLLLYGSLLFAYQLAPAVAVPFTKLAGVPSLGWLADPRCAFLGALATIVVFGFLANVNMIGVARMYRDRLMETFMPEEQAISENCWQPAPSADVTPITRFKDVRPLHLVNCNVVMIDANRDAFRGRGGDSFVISPMYSGSSATGFIPTKDLGTGGDRFSLATAMAISGAAANPNTGSAGRGITRNRAVAFLLSLLNIRLGYWIKNPAARNVLDSALTLGPPNFWFPGLRQGLLGRGLNEKAAFIELTDGGHFDNTGLYELVRRRTRFILLSQGSQDEKFAMADLANVIERVRVDFGVHIRFDIEEYNLEKLRPHQDGVEGVSKRGFAIARIRYPRPAASSQDDFNGALLYLQSTPVEGMRADVRSYRRSNERFPNEPTANQFFTEEQLEAYRELGMQIAESAIYTLEKLGKQDAGSPLAAEEKLAAPAGWLVVELYKAFVK